MKKNIWIVKWMWLNKRDMWIYEYIQKRNNEFDFFAIYSYPERFNISKINTKKIKILWFHSILILKFLRIWFSYLFWIFEYMIGFERKTKNIDLFETTETKNIFTLQALNSGKPTIVFCYENIPFNYERFPYNIIKKKVFKKAKYFITCDERIKETLKIENPKIKDNNILVSPPTIDIERYNTRNKSNKEVINFAKKYSIDLNKINILFTWRLLYEKWIYDIFYVIKLLSQKRDDFKLILTWSSYWSKKIKKLVKKLWIEKNIQFTWYIDNSQIHHLYNCADIFILASTITKIWNEQFGFVFLEAMASWLPIVWTWAWSLPYVINSEWSELSSPWDFYMLSTKIEKLLNNKKIREEYWKKNREYIEKKFNPKCIMKERICFYKKVLNGSVV